MAGMTRTEAKALGLSTKRLQGPAIVELGWAQTILDVAAKGGRYREIVLALGFLPVGTTNRQYGIEDLYAFAHRVISSDETKQQMIAEFRAEVRRRAINSTDIADIAEIIDGRLVARDTKDLTAQQKAAISEMGQTEHGVKIKLHDPIPALRLLGQATGAVVEKHELTGKNGGPIESVGITTTDPIEAAKAYAELIKGE